MVAMVYGSGFNDCQAPTILKLCERFAYNQGLLIIKRRQLKTMKLNTHITLQSDEDKLCIIYMLSD